MKLFSTLTFGRLAMKLFEYQKEIEIMEGILKVFGAEEDFKEEYHHRRSEIKRINSEEFSKNRPMIDYDDELNDIPCRQKGNQLHQELKQWFANNYKFPM